MPASTPALAIPYPLPGDAVIDYPTTGRELAELLDSLIRGSRKLTWSERATQWNSLNTTFVAATPFMPLVHFTADGVSSYLIRFSAPGWSNQGGAGGASLYLDLDGGATAPIMAYASALGVQYSPLNGAAFVTPAAGVHSVNARLVASAGNIYILAGGGYGPMILTVEELPIAPTARPGEPEAPGPAIEPPALA